MAVDMFLKLCSSGSNVLKGEARDSAKTPAHAGEIGVLSWAWGMTQTGSTHDGSGSGTGKVNVQDLSFTKFCDTASATLINYCCTGQHFESAVLTCRKAGGDAPLEYLIITLSNVFISSVSTGGGGSDERITEHVSLNFGKFNVKYNPQDGKGAGKGGMEATYDIQGHEA